MVLDFQQHREHCFNEYIEPQSTSTYYMNYYRVRTCIDVWNFDSGSIQANPASAFDGIYVTYRCDQPKMEGGHYKRSTSLKAITRAAATPYPFFEREFDIIKGKFTGRIADITTANDLLMRYPIIAEDNKTKDDGNNYVYSLLTLLKGYDGSNFTWTNMQNISRDYAVGLMTANFLGEGAKLGAP